MKPLLFVQWIVTLIICFWAGALAFSLTISNRPYPACQSQYCPDCCTSADWGNGSELGVFVVAIIAAIITFAQAVFFYRQLGIMGAAIKDAEITRESSLRPYIELEMMVAPKVARGTNIIFAFLCSNHGQTPARQYAFRAMHWFIPKGVPKAEDLPEIVGPWNSARGGVFPYKAEGSERRISQPCNIGDERRPTDAEVAAYDFGQTSLLLGIEIEYSGFFEGKYVTRVYYVMNAGTERIGIVPGGTHIS